MVFTAAQTRAFFEDNDQMAMERDTVAQLMQEGIQTVVDLIDFDEASLKQIAENLRRPAGRIPDPTIGNPGGAVAGSTIPCPPFVFGAKSQNRLLVATELLKFYKTIGRDTTVTNLKWNHVMRNFGEQWKAIKDKSKESEPEVPKISKTLPLIRWIEVFQDHCYRCLGVRYIPLAYVIRTDVAVPAVCPDAAINQPFSTEHGSVLDDLVMRAGHDHGLFGQDNQGVYFKLEEATRSTPYADSIKSFARKRDGRGAFLALVAQYAGKDKWEAEIKKSTDILHSRKWKSTQNFTLEKFIQQHRNAYVSLQACAERVSYQLPNAHSRVGYILDAIETDDAGLHAAMANVREDTAVGGKREDFEATAAYLLPKDPVARKRSQIQVNSKRGTVEISDVTAEISDFGSKPGIGKTGVHFRYYQAEEFRKLTKPQKDELIAWRDANPSSRKRDGKSTPTSPAKRTKAERKEIASLVKKGVADSLAARDKQADVEEQSKAVLMSLMKQLESKDSDTGRANLSSADSKEAKASGILKSILKKANTGKD